VRTKLLLLNNCCAFSIDNPSNSMVYRYLVVVWLPAPGR